MLPLRALEGVAHVDLSVHIRLKTIPIAAITGAERSQEEDKPSVLGRGGSG